MAKFDISTKELREYIGKLCVGDKILLSGTVFTARDAAHKRFFSLIDAEKPLPIDIKDAVIYYAGPTPAPSGKVIGSCGPTTSGRMDKYSPKLMDMGLLGMIGKGERSEQVRAAIVRNSAIYFCAIGGAGALAAECIKSVEVVAFEDLGCESVKKLQFEKFPLIVANDSFGGDIFTQGRAKFAEIV
ncbi:MAG: FumA C-terminus/TtdB family hydratase beta subunit [Oscillospiraceae bacterium]